MATLTEANLGGDAHLPPNRLESGAFVQGRFSLPFFTKEEDFIDIPPAPDATAVLADLRGELGAEGLRPGEHRARGHIDAPLGQQPGHLSSGDRQAEVPPHGHQDHVGGPAIAGESSGRGLGKVAAARATGEALVAARGMTVPVRGGLLAEGARWHGRGLYHPLTSRTPARERGRGTASSGSRAHPDDPSVGRGGAA
jgi:hypothetical protein